MSMTQELGTVDVRHMIFLTVVRDPQDGFTIGRLSRSLGLPMAAVREALDALLAAGLVRADGDEYVSTLLLD